MSYEGYEQIICQKGHYEIEDALTFMYEMEDEEWRCPECGSGMAWVNSVDVTNGSFEYNEETGEQERIDGYVELEVDESHQCECPICHVKHHSARPTYKIPEGVGRRLV